MPALQANITNPEIVRIVGDYSLTIAELARRLGVSRRAVGRWKNHKSRLTRMQQLALLGLRAEFDGK